MHVCPSVDVKAPRKLEEAARKVIRELLGLELVFADSNGGADFCATASGEHIGIVEVTRHTDEDWRRQEAQLEGFAEVAAEVEGEWQLDLARAVGPRDAMSRMDRIAELIRQIEANGIDHYPFHQFDDENVISQLEELGVPSGYQWRSDRSGLVHLSAMGIPWWSGDEHLIEAIETAVTANEKKLADAVGRRHLFLWVEFEALPAFEQLRTGGVPKADPDLRSLAEEVWIAPADPLQGQTRLPVWRFSGEGWSTHECEIPDELYDHD